MNTPILDFVKKYNEQEMSRLHMPGHKGFPYLGCEPYDITEIQGADVLYDADGIINESEENASRLFGSSHTFYSAEGSSLAIKTMLSLVLSEWTLNKEKNPGTLSSTYTRRQRPFILAARNVHKSFIYGCALLDLDVEWLYPEDYTSLCSCRISADSLDKILSEAIVMPAAVYLTSPDYLGFIQDIEGIAKVCDKYHIPLLVDNAHGAYTKFLQPSLHPIDLGASMCCDSAHKTLPVLTGGAYLHISKKAPEQFLRLARNTMALFASTSPSYLILQSLDFCNKYLSDQYPDKLALCIEQVNKLKTNLYTKGFHIESSEPLKLVINSLKSGYLGDTLSSILRTHQIEVEFADPEYVVMMFTPEISDRDYDRIYRAFSFITPKDPLEKPVFSIEEPLRRCSIREAVFGFKELTSPKEAIGKISASPSVSCPPAIPIVVSGEEITAQAVKLFEYYGIHTVETLRQL